MRTDFADFPLPSLPTRSVGGAPDIDRRERAAGERDTRFALPQEPRRDARHGRDAESQRSETAQRRASGADTQPRKDSQARDSQARSDSGNSASDHTSVEKPASGKDMKDKASSGQAPGTDASNGDTSPGAKLRAMGAVSLIALMRSGSAAGKADGTEGDPLPGLVENSDLVTEGDPESISDAASGKVIAAHAHPEGVLAEKSVEQDPARIDAEDVPEQDGAVTPVAEAEQGLPDGEAHHMHDGAESGFAVDETAADAAMQASAAAVKNASSRNADPARGDLPAQASDAARAALARTPGLAGRMAGGEGGAVAPGEEAADAQAGEDGSEEGASTALKANSGEGRSAAERLTGVEQEAARRGAAETGSHSGIHPRTTSVTDQAGRAFEILKPGAIAASGEAAAQLQTPAALDATKAVAGAQPAQTNGAVLVNTPLSAVPLALGMKAMAGASRFEIRLDPAELGRIDVRLDIDKEGNVKARLTVDRVETLHLLQRDARTLERAFEQAGLRPSEDGIDLSLRDERGDESRREARDEDDEVGPPSRGAGNEEAGRREAEIRALARETLLVRQAMRRALGGVDLSI